MLFLYAYFYHLLREVGFVPPLFFAFLFCYDLRFYDLIIQYTVRGSNHKVTFQLQS